MNGKHLPPLRIEPQEAIALFTHAKVEEMYRVKRPIHRLQRSQRNGHRQLMGHYELAIFCL